MPLGMRSWRVSFMMLRAGEVREIVIQGYESLVQQLLGEGARGVFWGPVQTKNQAKWTVGKAEKIHRGHQKGMLR
jgi:hypothetical protein